MSLSVSNKSFLRKSREVSPDQRAGNRLSRRVVVFNQERYDGRLSKLAFLETTSFNLESIFVTRPFVCSARAPHLGAPWEND